MRLEKFRDIVERSNFTLDDKQRTKEGNILIAHKYCPDHPEYKGPHWQYLWGIEREGYKGGDVDVGQVLYFRVFDSTHVQRVNAVVETAKQWIEDNLEVGRYGD